MDKITIAAIQTQICKFKENTNENIRQQIKYVKETGGADIVCLPER